MLKNQNIICISSIDWDFIWQGHQEIMSSFAANGNRVLFIENTGVRAPGIKDFSRLRKRFRDYFKGVKGIRKESGNLYIFSPIVLPFPYSRPARWINRMVLLTVLKRWMRAVDFADPVIWTFLPTGIALDITENVDKKLLVYYCIDNFAVSSASAKKVKSTEARLIRSADLVFVTSSALYDYCRTYSEKVHLFPFGVNIENFEKVRNSDTHVPREIAGFVRPIIGYVGGVHKWIDQDIVRDVAEKLSGYDFVFVGPVQTDISKISGLANVHFLGAKRHEDLPALVKSFSAAIIPYLITDYTRNVYPTKLNEYLSMGKPVISTDLPEISAFNRDNGGIVYIGSDSVRFGSEIERALKEDNDALRRKRIDASKRNSWKSRIEEMSSMIEAAAEAKLLERETRWKEDLIGIYRRVRMKIIKFSAAALIIYASIFYTPILWYLAEPLKITQDPRSADVIVVFGGGVGESGKPGEGYIERLGRAVDLYKKGYAKHIIFSSGYTYVFQEPQIMKAIAVSLGVPEDAITLEENAGNTYENVKFTRDIMNKMRWRSALLVSSPYHMRRVSLVYHKIGGGMEVTFVPVENSSFYAHRTKGIYKGGIVQQIKMRQIKGIVHEYAGIIYYWWKGYI